MLTSDLYWGTEEEIKDSDKKESNTVDDDDEEISVSGNHIYFYNNITKSTAKSFNRALIKLASKLNSVRIVKITSSPIKQNFPKDYIFVHINSPGGSLMDAFAITDVIKQVTNSESIIVASIVEGCAASAATLVSLSCQERMIREDAMFMIHQLSGWHAGTYEQLKDRQALSDKLMDKLVDFYESKSNLTKIQVKKLLKKDKWFDSKDALKHGFVDTII